VSTIGLAKRDRVTGWGAALAVLLVAELLFFAFTTRNFLGHGSGMLALSEQFIPTGVLALGQAPVILTGNIDLSSGGVASLSAIVVGVRLHDGSSIWFACLLGIAVGAAVGLFNGLIVSYLGIESLLATLATQFIATSLATSVGGQSPPYLFGAAFDKIGRGTVGGVPYPLIGFLVLSAATIVLIRRTGFGRSLVLMGFSLAVARYTGIKARLTLTVVFTLSGAFAGIAGVLLASYYDAARPDSGTALLLPAIAMVVLGGVDIFGGRGRIGEVVLAVFLLGYLTQGLLIDGYSSLTATMVTGLLLIAALLARVALTRSGGESTAAAIRRRLAVRARARAG
jgi:ribose/xylose/arabinose/galactoside ABC-type transport system permease subunit